MINQSEKWAKQNKIHSKQLLYKIISNFRHKKKHINLNLSNSIADWNTHTFKEIDREFPSYFLGFEKRGEREREKNRWGRFWNLRNPRPEDLNARSLVKKKNGTRSIFCENDKAQNFLGFSFYFLGSLCLFIYLSVKEKTEILSSNIVSIIKLVDKNFWGECRTVIRDGLGYSTLVLFWLVCAPLIISIHKPHVGYFMQDWRGLYLYVAMYNWVIWDLFDGVGSRW